jgi:protein-ribulosamine 3-kinase
VKEKAHDEDVVKALSEFLGFAEVTSITAISGGCINEAYSCTTDIARFFLKVNQNENVSMFGAEALGLETLYASGSVRVPKPQFYTSLPRGGSLLLMEYIPFGGEKSWSQKRLGENLASLHLQSEEKRFGFFSNNTIGSTPQKNTWSSDWVDFFSLHRLQFQLDLAFKKYGNEDLKELGEKLLKVLPKYFEGLKIFPSLIHGDLWSGNMAVDEAGNPVIFDPAVYYGHHEAELGIMAIFGGFSEEFYSAYHEKIPKERGFGERHELYKLYHYLNHLNIFGSSYFPVCFSIMKSLLKPGGPPMAPGCFD